MKRYRNISDKQLLIIGVPGPINPGETVEVDGEINNANFELVKNKPSKSKESYKLE